jgi:hypothetical protein
MVVDVLTVGVLPRHQHGALARVERGEGGAGAGVRDHDVRRADRLLELVAGHLGTGLDRQALDVGHPALAGELHAGRQDRQHPLHKPAEVVRDRAERQHDSLDARLVPALDRGVAVEHRPDVGPALTRPEAVLGAELDARDAGKDASGKRGPLAARGALDVGDPHAPRPGHRQKRQRDAGARADHVAEAPAAEQPPGGHEVARSVAPVARRRVVDVDHILAVEQAAALGRVEGDPGAPVARDARNPRGQGVQLGEVAAGGGNQQRSFASHTERVRAARSTQVNAVWLNGDNEQW